MIPNLFLICKNLCQDWSVTEAGVRWGELRPRSCKLLNCSNLPVMAAAQSGGWTHAMHSSTFGSELGGKRRWNRCVHVPTLLKRFTALVRWLLQRLLPATANTRATIKGNGTFQLANLPPQNQRPSRFADQASQNCELQNLQIDKEGVRWFENLRDNNCKFATLYTYFFSKTGDWIF